MMERLEHLDGAAVFRPTGTKTKKRVRRIEWFAQPPARRTVLLKNPGAEEEHKRVVARRIDFPELVFAVVWDEKHAEKQFGVLAAFTRDSALGPICPHTPLRVFGSNTMSGWTVCLGEARALVRRGLLDPFEAYWNTAFDTVEPSGVDRLVVRVRNSAKVENMTLTPQAVNWCAGAAGPPPSLGFDPLDSREIEPCPR